MNVKKYFLDLISNKNFHFSIALFVLAIVTLWIIDTLNIAYPINITTRQVSAELAVVGEGKVDVIPDTGIVTLGIVVNNVVTVEEAQKKINEVNNSIVASLEELGINEEDIKTSNYSINPSYNYRGNERTINGYNGNASLTVKVRDIDLLPKVITNSTEAGANQVLGTNFVIDEPEKYREDARDKAIENAREQAKKLADKLGIKLGKVTNIVESDSSAPPIYEARSLSLEGLGGVEAPDLQPGSQTISSTVTLYFEKR